MVNAYTREESGALTLKASMADVMCGSILAGKATGVIRGVRSQEEPLAIIMLEILALVK